MTELHSLVGHEDVRHALVRAHGAGGLPAAVLIHGPKGVGKQRLALWMAQLQICDEPGPQGPCGACRPCRMCLAVEHPDLHWYFPLPRPKGVSGDRLTDALEAARAEALAELRANPIQPSQGDELRGIYLGLIQGLRRKATLRPTMAACQVFIIADAEFMVPQESSPEAANALLKLLEEPPPATRFILTASEPGRLLPTIRSRTVPLHASPLPEDAVAGFLQHHAGADSDTARWAAGLAQGSIGRALGFLPEGPETPGALEARRQEALAVLEAALAEGRAPGFNLALAQTAKEARRLVELFAFMEEWLRDLAAVAAGAEERVVSRDTLPRLRALASTGIHPSAVAAALPLLEESRVQARGNVNPQLIVAELVRRLRRALRPTPTARR